MSGASERISSDQVDVQGRRDEAGPAKATVDAYQTYAERQPQPAGLTGNRWELAPHPDDYARAERERADADAWMGFEAPAWAQPGHGHLPPANEEWLRRDADTGKWTRHSSEYFPHDNPPAPGEINGHPHPYTTARPAVRYPGQPEYSDLSRWDDDAAERFLSRQSVESCDEESVACCRQKSAEFFYPSGEAYPPLALFRPEQCDIEVMWRWVRSMEPETIEERARGWHRCRDLLEEAGRTLRSRGNAVTDSWHSAVDDHSAADGFRQQIGGTLFSMAWWERISNHVATDLSTIATAIRDTTELLGPVYAHYRSALALLESWESMLLRWTGDTVRHTVQFHSRLMELDGTPISWHGVWDIDGYPAPVAGTYIYGSGGQSHNEGKIHRMRINNPGNPDWTPAVPVLYDGSLGRGNNVGRVSIREPVDLLRHYHLRAAEIVQPLANLYNNTHHFLPTQDRFQGPDLTSLGQPFDPAEVALQAMQSRLPGGAGIGGGGLGVAGSGLSATGAAPAGMAMPAPPAAPSIPPPVLGSPEVPTLSPRLAGDPGGYLAGGPVAGMVGGMPGGGGPALPATPPPPAMPGALAAGAGPPPVLGRHGLASTGLSARAHGVAPAASAPGLSPATGPAAGASPAPGPRPVLGTPAPGGSAPGQPGATGSAALPGATARPGMMPPPIVPPMAPQQAGQGGRQPAPPAGGARLAGASGQTPAVFVPPGQVNPPGSTPTAPRRVEPTLPGQAARPPAHGASQHQPRQHPHPQPYEQPPPEAPEQVPVAGDLEMWTVRKPRGALRGGERHQPAPHGTALGSPG